jgi:hypothetical protein
MSLGLPKYISIPLDSSAIISDLLLKIDRNLFKQAEPLLPISGNKITATDETNYRKIGRRSPSYLDSVNPKDFRKCSFLKKQLDNNLSIFA